jgi:hypothetical protein
MAMATGESWQHHVLLETSIEGDHSAVRAMQIALRLESSLIQRSSG